MQWSLFYRLVLAQGTIELGSDSSSSFACLLFQGGNEGKEIEDLVPM